jgi:hypothetical protein
MPNAAEAAPGFAGSGGGGSNGEDSRDYEDDDAPSIEIIETRGAGSATEAGARIDDVPAPPEPEAGMDDRVNATFRVFFTGFAKAGSTSDGLFEPDLAFGTATFRGKKLSGSI